MKTFNHQNCEEIDKALLDMKSHETIAVELEVKGFSQSTALQIITRVPGGWIYSLNVNGDTHPPVFVPIPANTNKQYDNYTSE